MILLETYRVSLLRFIRIFHLSARIETLKRIPLEDNEKKILINVEDDETRIAVVDNATLDNLYIEQTHRTQILGNIYFGKVVKIQPSFQAAFVD